MKNLNRIDISHKRHRYVSLYSFGQHYADVLNRKWKKNLFFGIPQKIQAPYWISYAPNRIVSYQANLLHLKHIFQILDA